VATLGDVLKQLSLIHCVLFNAMALFMPLEVQCQQDLSQLSVLMWDEWWGYHCLSKDSVIVSAEVCHRKGWCGEIL